MGSQRLDQRLVAPPCPEFVAAAGEDGGRAGLGGKAGDFVTRRPAPEDEGRAKGRQVFRQAGQAVVQPPARGAANGPWAGRLIIETEDRQDRLPGRHRRVERSVVGKPQIVAVVQQDGRLRRLEHSLNLGPSGGFATRS